MLLIAIDCAKREVSRSDTYLDRDAIIEDVIHRMAEKERSQMLNLRKHC